MKVVCDIANTECMVHAGNIQGTKAWDHICELVIDINDVVSYTQSDSTGRTTLQAVTLSIIKFLELLVYQADNLAAHSFIVKSQALYLKERKI